MNALNIYIFIARTMLRWCQHTAKLTWQFSILIKCLADGPISRAFSGTINWFRAEPTKQLIDFSVDFWQAWETKQSCSWVYPFFGHQLVPKLSIFSAKWPRFLNRIWLAAPQILKNKIQVAPLVYVNTNHKFDLELSGRIIVCWWKLHLSSHNIPLIKSQAVQFVALLWFIPFASL